jgi:hypothetical protein
MIIRASATALAFATTVAACSAGVDLGHDNQGDAAPGLGEAGGDAGSHCDLSIQNGAPCAPEGATCSSTCTEICGNCSTSSDCTGGHWVQRPVPDPAWCKDASPSDSAPGDGSLVDGDGSTQGCPGSPNRCFGNNTANCCALDPAPATCVGGIWMCGSVPAPGCNGTACMPQGCTGTAPNCFGSDLSACCGRDPFPATCVGNQWTCFSTSAPPGCNGTTCVDQGQACTPGSNDCLPGLTCCPCLVVDADVCAGTATCQPGSDSGVCAL